MSELATLRKTIVEQRREIRKLEEQIDAAVVATRLAVIQSHLAAGETSFPTAVLDGEVWAATSAHRQAVESANKVLEEMNLAIDLLIDKRNDRVLAALEKIAARAAQGRAE